MSSTIERFGSGGPFEDLIGYSRVVRAGDLFVTAGCTATVDGELIGVGDAYRQAITAFTIGLDALERAGCPRDRVIQTRMYITDRANADAVGRAHSELFDSIRPVSAMIIVAGFLTEQMLVEVELTAFGADACVATAKVPKAVAR
jgi:enamine deaminase RidA (YjgF/YER057c/UK114 family)